MSRKYPLPVRSSLRSRPLYGLVGYHLWHAYNRNAQFTDKSPVTLAQMYRSDLALVTRRFATLERAITRQRANSDTYEGALQVDSSMLCRERPGMYYNRYIYPVLFSSLQERDAVATYLRREGIDTARPYRDIAITAATYYGYAGDCPVAEGVAQRVLAIPNYHTLKSTEVVKIAGALNVALRKARGRGMARP